MKCNSSSGPRYMSQVFPPSTVQESYVNDRQKSEFLILEAQRQSNPKLLPDASKEEVWEPDNLPRSECIKLGGRFPRRANSFKTTQSVV